jgi:hypothetical protein
MSTIGGVDVLGCVAGNALYGEGVLDAGALGAGSNTSFLS